MTNLQLQHPQPQGAQPMTFPHEDWNEYTQGLFEPSHQEHPTMSPHDDTRNEYTQPAPREEHSLSSLADLITDIESDPSLAFPIPCPTLWHRDPDLARSLLALQARWQYYPFQLGYILHGYSLAYTRFTPHYDPYIRHELYSLSNHYINQAAFGS